MIRSLAIVSILTTSALAEDAPKIPDYDVFDGRGKSGKKLDFVEWAGNYEIHAYPKGSIVGLALKLDKRNKDKPVMVIGLRFDNNPQKQYIRRAILTIPMSEGFKAFRDPTVPNYDKIIISNQGMGGSLQVVKLDPEPTQMYPDGHPALAKTGDQNKERSPATQTTTQQKAQPSSKYPYQPMQQAAKQNPNYNPVQPQHYEQKPYAQPAYERDPALEQKKEKKEVNQIQHFSW